MTAITRLTLTDFRSHAHTSIDARPGLVVITGDNGAGKTNILDAISLLAPGRGLRGAPLSDAARQDGPGGWSVAAHLISAEGEVQIGTGTAAAAPERRLVRVNGAAATATIMPATAPPIRPSTVLFGLMRGLSLVRPNFLPTK